jgi:hypothetical protein
MARSIGRLDRAAEERPWVTGLAVGVPAGVALAVVFALVDGEGFADPGRILATGVVQGLVIAVLVASGGAWRMRSRKDQRRAVGRGDDAGDGIGGDDAAGDGRAEDGGDDAAGDGPTKD